MDVLLSPVTTRVASSPDDRCPGPQPAYGRLSQAMAFFQLRHLLKAGVAMDKALEEVQLLETSLSHQRLWRDVRRRLDDGESLSMALSRWHRVFEPSVIALIQAGEASGQLDSVLDRLEAQLRWQHAIAQKLLAVMSYPLFAGLVVGGVSWFLLGSVVPSMAGFLGSSGAPLSWHASLLLGLSERVEYAGSGLVVFLCLALSVSLILPRLSRGLRYARDAIVLRTPVIGRLLIALDLARYCRTLALLNEHGVALDEAMALSEGVAGNDVMKLELQQLRLSVLAGESLTQAIEHCQIMPSSTRRMISAGEMAGALNEALNHNAEQLQSFAGFRIERIERLLGPSLMVLLGALLMWIIVSILLPVYDVALQAGAL